MNKKYIIIGFVIALIIGAFVYWNNSAFPGPGSVGGQRGFSLESDACQELIAGQTDEQSYALLSEIAQEVEDNSDVKDVEAICLARLTQRDFLSEDIGEFGQDFEDNNE